MRRRSGISMKTMRKAQMLGMVSEEWGQRCWVTYKQMMLNSKSRLNRLVMMVLSPTAKQTNMQSTPVLRKLASKCALNPLALGSSCGTDPSIDMCKGTSVRSRIVA